MRGFFRILLKKWQRKSKTHGVENLRKQQKILMNFWTEYVVYCASLWLFWWILYSLLKFLMEENKISKLLTRMICIPFVCVCVIIHLPGMLLQVRRGAGVSNDEILAFAKLFNDELTLDNISRLDFIVIVWRLGSI